MDTVLIVALAVVAASAICVAAYFYFKYRERTALKKQFGPEYAHAIDEAGNVREAEGRLRQRERRVRSLSLHALAEDDRSRYSDAWQKIQAEFVDEPKSAVSHADGLLDAVMRARGYPVSDFEQRSADLSVHHPIAVQNYRIAHESVGRQVDGKADTEDLRQAMVHYQTVFNELLNDNEDKPVRKAS